MDLTQVVLLAIVEGITEFLPVSSTGHLVLVSRVMNLEQSEFVKSFEIAIQLGAILSVVVLYFRKLLADVELVKKVGIAFIPTGVIGLFSYKLIKNYLIGNFWMTVLALGFGGAAMLILEKKLDQKKGKSISELSWKQAVMIGVVQAISVVPGVSRAMATIFGGVGVGLSRVAAVEMSFLLAIPTMAAATGLDLVKSGVNFTSGEWMSLGVGFGAAFVTAMAAVKWLLEYVKKRDLVVFGWYRIILAVTFGLVLLSAGGVAN